MHLVGFFIKKIIRKLYFKSGNILFVCVIELQVQQSGICRNLCWWCKNTFHCPWQNNDRVWVAELSGLFCYKIIHFWKVIRGLFVGCYMYQVLHIVVRSEISFIAWSMYLEPLRLIAVMPYVKERTIEMFIFRFHELRNIYTFVLYQPMHTDKICFISVHWLVYYISVNER